jgi:hypothetical protein
MPGSRLFIILLSLLRAGEYEIRNQVGCDASERAMMILLGSMVVLITILFGVIVLWALKQGRDVKASLKIPLATFLFEASEHHQTPGPAAGPSGSLKRTL